VHVCLALLPHAVRRRLARARPHESGAWHRRFAAVAADFCDALGVHAKGESRARSGEPGQQRFQRAFLAYLDTWPLADGATFEALTPRELLLRGAPRRLRELSELRDESKETHETGHQAGKHRAHMTRLVVNAKGAWLLGLTSDSMHTRSVALLWHAALADLVALELRRDALEMRTRQGDRVVLACPDPALPHRAIIAQCTANLAAGDPRIHSDLKLVHLARAFPELSWPPAPPKLSADDQPPPDSEAEPRDDALDLGSAAAVLANLFPDLA
jgi:hypothetical protein